MNICLVTAFPPSRHALNEYGFHIARELAREPGLNLTILGDDLDTPQPELPEYKVVRCWAFEKWSNPVRLLRAIRRLQPDIVWYNIGFASFGGSPIPAFIGLATPALTRLSGCYTHVTLHQLVETVDLNDAGVKSPLLYKVAGAIATHMLLSANSISVLLPAYRRILRDHVNHCGERRAHHHAPENVPVVIAENFSQLIFQARNAVNHPGHARHQKE